MKPNVTTTTAPAKRQMKGLYALKPWFTGMLTPILNAAVARRVSPDVFTAAGVVGGRCGRSGRRTRMLAAGGVVSRTATGRRQPRRRGCPRPWSESAVGLRRSTKSVTAPPTC